MATIEKYFAEKKLQSEEMKEPPGCDFCGEFDADVYWWGVSKEIFICRSCCMSVLPTLLADLIGKEIVQFPHKKGTLEKADGILEKIKAKFYRTVALHFEIALRSVVKDERKQSDG